MDWISGTLRSLYRAEGDERAIAAAQPRPLLGEEPRHEDLPAVCSAPPLCSATRWLRPAQPPASLQSPRCPGPVRSALPDVPVEIVHELLGQVRHEVAVRVHVGVAFLRHRAALLCTLASSSCFEGQVAHVRVPLRVQATPRLAQGDFTHHYFTTPPVALERMKCFGLGGSTPKAPKGPPEAWSAKEVKQWAETKRIDASLVAGKDGRVSSGLCKRARHSSCCPHPQERNSERRGRRGSERAVRLKACLGFPRDTGAAPVCAALDSGRQAGQKV